MLVVLGAVVAVAGIVLVGFAIPASEITRATAVLIVGTAALMGGLMLIGFAVVVHELRRVGRALAARPLRPREAAGATAARPGPSAAPGRIPFPLKPHHEGESRAPRPLQPRQSVAAAGAPTEPGPPERLRESPPPLTNVGVAEAVAAAPDGASTSSGGKIMESAPAARTNGSVPPHIAMPLLDPPWRASGPAKDAAPPTMFDSVWPAETRRPRFAGKTAEAATAAAPKSAEAAANNQDDRAAVAMNAAGAPQATSIIKSGVVDGMAYTLYSDGAIEAELAQGTVRFKSIDDLRLHLEKSA